MLERYKVVESGEGAGEVFEDPEGEYVLYEEHLEEMKKFKQLHAEPLEDVQEIISYLMGL